MTRRWYKRGKTRISLVNTRNTVVNTVAVVDDDVSRPARLTCHTFSQPGTTRKCPLGNAAPKENQSYLIALPDVDGDGAAAEFSLYDMPACTGPAPHVFGYNPKEDRIAH